MKSLPFILVVLLAISCTTPKNVNQENQVDYSGVLQQMQARIDSLFYGIRLMHKETNERFSDLTIENKTTHFSAPDSIGRQYTTVVKETIASKKEKENKTSDIHMEAIIQQLIAEVYELQQHLDVSLKEKEKVKEISWWKLYKADVYALLFALIIVGWLVYKKRKK